VPTTARHRAATTEPIGPTIVLLLCGAAVAVFLGVYGRVHPPAAQTSTSMVFWSVTFESGAAMLQFKSTLTTIAVLLALFQLLTGLRLRDRLRWPHQIPLWLGDVHRLTGTLVLVVTLPVAYHCLWSLGFKTDLGNPRAVAHSLFGCFFYGAYVTKVLAVRRGTGPDWLIPVVGGTVLVVLTVVWLSSSLFFVTGRIG
jgi:hypothetical protein